MDHQSRLEQGAKVLKTIGTTLLKKKEQAIKVQARYQKMKASIGKLITIIRYYSYMYFVKELID